MSIALPESHLMEHKFAQIIAQQEVDGWEFDYNTAMHLYDELTRRMEEIYSLVRPHLVQERVIKYAPVLTPFKKDGSTIKRVCDYWGEDVEKVYGGYSPVHWEEPDIGSRQKLMKQLQRHGWKPVNVTEKGNPKLDEESLQGLDLGETGNLLMEYYKAKQRRSTLLGDKGNGWLTAAYEYSPGKYKITAEANPCGTNTHRCTHRVVVNVPKADPTVYYGEQFRSLYIAPPGRQVFGADAEQLEFRCALSYMDAKEMIKLVADPEVDVHSVLWDEMKPYMDSRSTTKNIVYGSIYGASARKLGTMSDNIPKGMSGDLVGEKLKAALLKYMPGLDSFERTVKAAAGKGFIVGIDGFPVYIRRKDGDLLLHTAINTLLQHCGSMVVKRATVYFHEEIEKCQLVDKFTQTGHFHDEIQGHCEIGMGPVFGEMFHNALVKAGEFYELSCPMAGDWKVGKSWAETH